MAGPSPIDRVLGAIVPRAVGAVDIDEVLGQVDVDHLVSEVDLDKVLERIDLQAVLERVDLERVLDRIDLDALLARLDVEGLLARIDVNALAGRLDVDALVAGIDVGALISRVDIDGLVKRVDVDALVQQVDVDGIVSRVDINGIVEQVDVDAVVGRVDINGIVGRVDLDEIVAQVDVDGIIGRVDVPAVMARAHIDEIVSNASRGMTTRLLDLVRRQLAAMDLVLISLVDRIFRRPRETAGQADGSLTGWLAGGVSRLAAYFVDIATIAVSYSLTVGVGVFLVALFSGNRISLSHHGWEWAVGYGVFGFFYYWIALTIAGRSIGKGLVGLRVVNRDRTAITPGRAAVRTLVYPFSFILGLGLIPIVTAKRRRALHDKVAGTVVVYDWGDRPAEVSRPVSEWLRRRDAQADPLGQTAAALAAVPDPGSIGAADTPPGRPADPAA